MVAFRFSVISLLLVCASCKQDLNPPDPAIVAGKQAQAHRDKLREAQNLRAREAREKSCESAYTAAASRAVKIQDKDVRKKTLGVLKTQRTVCPDYAAGKINLPDFQEVAAKGELQAKINEMSPAQRKAYEAMAAQRLRCKATDTLCMARKDPLMVAKSLVEELRLAHRDAVKAANALRRTGNTRRCQLIQAGLNPSSRRESIPAARIVAKRYAKLGQAIEKANLAQFQCLTCDATTPASECIRFRQLITKAKRALKRAR